MRRLIFSIISVFCISITAFGQEETVPNDSVNIGTHTELVPKAMEDYSKSAADSAYANGNYTEAIQIYEFLLQTGESAEIYYNLGNSYFKADNIAKAILNYERSLLLDPGNSDTRFNLNVARSKTIDKIDQTPDLFLTVWFQSLMNCFSVKAWSRIAIAFFIIFLAALAVYLFSKKVIIKKIGFFAAIFFLIFSCLGNVFASQQKNRLENRKDAIVISPSVVVRSTPSEDGTSLFILHEGTKVKIKDDSMREWKEIRLEDDKIGWMPVTALEQI